ncbi:hypothetical protein [Streptomyces sp. NPDC053755]
MTKRKHTNKNVIGTAAAVGTAALAVVAVVRGVLPDVRRYLRMSRM